MSTEFDKTLSSDDCHGLADWPADGFPRVLEIVAANRDQNRDLIRWALSLTPWSAGPNWKGCARMPIRKATWIPRN
jgi:hypothetical protein